MESIHSLECKLKNLRNLRNQTYSSSGILLPLLSDGSLLGLRGLESPSPGSRSREPPQAEMQYVHPYKRCRRGKKITTLLSFYTRKMKRIREIKFWGSPILMVILSGLSGETGTLECKGLIIFLTEVSSNHFIASLYTIRYLNLPFVSNLIP